MTAEVIGEAQVLITADFSTFDDELRAKLTNAARKAGNDAEKILKRSGDKAGTGFADGVSKAAASRRTLDSIRASIERLEAAAKRAGDVQADAAGKVRVAEAALAKVKQKNANDTARIIAAEERLAKARRDAARSDNLAATATKALNAARNKLAVEATRQGEEAGKAFSDGLKRATVRGSDDAGKDAGGFFARAFEGAAGRAIGKGLFATLIAGLGAAVTAATPLSTVLGGLTAAVVALAAALVQAGGAALALPGVLGGILAAVGALKVGFTGMGDAVKAQTTALAELREEGEISEATQKKLDAALKNLAPSAAAVVKQLGAMAPAWEAVRRSVQERLFTGISKTIANLGNRFLPVLSRQLTITAGILNTTVRGLGRFLNNSQRAEQVGQIFGRLNSILQTLLRPLTALTGALLTAFQGTLPFAQRLATTLSNLGTRFAQFLNRATADGSLEQFLNGAFQAASELFRLLGNLGRVIGSVFTAGQQAGGSLLTILANLTGQLATFLKSAEGQSALAGFFGLIGQAVTIVTNAFRVLQPLLGGIGALFTALQGPLQALGTAILPVVSQLATTLGNAFRVLAPSVAALVTGLTPLVTTILTVAVTLFQQLLAAALPLVPAIVQIATSLATGLTSSLQMLVPVIIQAGANLLSLVNALLPLLPAVLALIPPAVQLSQAFLQMIIALQPLTTALLGSLIQLLVQLTPAILAVIPALVAMINGFTRTIQTITRMIEIVVRFAVQVTSSFNAARAAAISAIGAMISGVLGFFSRLPGQVQGHMTNFASAVQRGIDRAVQFFRNLPGLVVSALSGLGGRLRSAAADAMNGLIGGLQAALGRVRSVASEIAGAITGPVGKLLKISSPSRVMFELAKFAGDGLVNGLLSSVSAVSAASAKLAGAVPRQIETAAVVTDSRVQMGAAIVGGFLGALQSEQQALDAQMIRLAEVIVDRLLTLLQSLNLPGVNTLNIPGLKEGGVVKGKGAAGTLRRVGEYGRAEAVIPLTRPKRARELMDSTGLSALVAGGKGKSRTVEVPINVAGNVVDYAALTAHIESVLRRFGFVPSLGIQTSGGAL